NVSFTTTIITMPEWGSTCCVAVPDEVAIRFKEAGVSRIVCMINEDDHYHCAINKSKQHGYFILFSKARQKATGVSAGDELEVTLLADESEYGMPMPKEWAEVLAIDEDAYERFQKLTPGRQRNILHLVGSAKREETRINRALLIAENLKMGATDTREFMRKL
ncbi:MAG: YdeI/OmpD-associated family protein, partial [Bacteroidota bacterium]